MSSQLQQIISRCRVNILHTNAIPGPSGVALLNYNQFNVQHLQVQGLTNDGNVCCVLSFILCCHRIVLRSFFPRPNQIVIGNNRADYGTLVFLQILEALPHPAAFSVQRFIRIWNGQRLPLRITQNEDISNIADHLLDHFPLLPFNGSPIITKFQSSYLCGNCGYSRNNVNDWNNKLFRSIPNLTIPAQNQPISVAQLLEDFLQDRPNITCGGCGNNVIGDIVVIKGMFTVLTINRIDYAARRPVINQTRLDNVRTNLPSEQYLGELLSCVSHRQVPHWHYVSSHFVNNQWYLNDDHHVVNLNAPLPFHPFQSNVPTDNVNCVVYKTT